MANIGNHRKMHLLFQCQEEYFIIQRRIYAAEEEPAIENWANAKDYPAVSELDIDGWRWEFIRRSSFYKKYWADSHKPDAHPRFEYTRLYDRPGVDIVFGLAYLIDPRLSAQKISDVLRWRKGGYLQRWDDGEDFCSDEGDDDKCDRGVDALEDDRVALAKRFTPEIENFRRSGTFLATIDATKPLKPQFDEIERFADRTFPRAKKDRAESRRHQPRLRMENYPTYIRLLDARESAKPASWKEIANQILSERKSNVTIDTVRNLYEQALDTRFNFFRAASEVQEFLDL